MLHKPRYEWEFPWSSQNDNLLMTSLALIGTVEELSASQQTLNLVRDQFEVNYFGPMNIIKATLPHMRRDHTGHIMILSGISKTFNAPDPRDPHLTSNSGAHRHTRTWNVLRGRLGT